MKIEPHWLIAKQICDQPKVLFSQIGELQWTIFKTGNNSFFVVCTPENETSSFIPVLKFYYKLFSNEKETIETYSFDPKTRILERSVTITATLPNGFKGHIDIFAAIDNYPPLHTNFAWT